MARVSIRTLRHYEEEGLLLPAQVDAETGYRYYRADQLMLIHRVGAMRDIGLSIAQIRQLLTLDAQGLIDRSALRADPTYLPIANDPAWIAFLGEKRKAP